MSDAGQETDFTSVSSAALPPSSAIRWATVSLFLLLAGWLLAAALLVDLEYYDGYSAVCNARYFLGLSHHYIGDRMPLMAMVLMPAEFLKSCAGMHPLEVRPHHLTLALLHLAYLFAVYQALVGQFGSNGATLLAFAAAVPNFVFFSYAPFLSHDLIPGAALLWMVICSVAYLRAPSLSRWSLLVLLGTASALLKQTYALFWIVVLLMHAPLVFDSVARARQGRAWLQLAAGAAVSGIITWLLLAWVLESWAPEWPALLRPWLHLRYEINVHAGKDIQFPVWVYVRNLPSYGLLTMALLIPGIVVSLRGTTTQRAVAATWLLSLALMHVVHLREVRYIAYLAPLSAFLLVPAMRVVLRSKALSLLVVVLLAGDLAAIIPEAARIGDDFYRRSEIKRFLAPLIREDSSRRPVVANVAMLSFVSPRATPLAGDRYHRVFNFGIHHLATLYGYSHRDVVLARPPELAATLSAAPEGCVFLYSSHILARSPALQAGPPPEGNQFFQCLARLQSIELRGTAEEGWRTPADARVQVVADADGFVLRGDSLEAPPAAMRGMLLVHGVNEGYWLQPVEGAYRIMGLRDRSPLQRAEQITLRWIVVERYLRGPDFRTRQPGLPGSHAPQPFP